MPEKDPTTYSLLTYAWILFLSSWGGCISYYKKIKNGEITRFSVVEMIGELSTASFAGVITFFLCEYAGISPLFTAALVGASGHMGSKSIYLFEQYLKKRFIK